MHAPDIFGNHRGGALLALQMPESLARRYRTDWVLADPKEGRADRLAELLRRRLPFLRPRPLLMTGNEAIPHTEIDDHLVVTADNLRAIRDTIDSRHPRQQTSFQIVGRGPGGDGGTRLGLQGTIQPGDTDTENAVRLLISALEEMSRDASSRELTEADPLTASSLKPMRHAVTAQTLRHMATESQEPDALPLGALTAAFGQESVFPLVPVEGRGIERYRHKRDLALDTAIKLPTARFVDRGLSGKFVVVAVVDQGAGAVDLMTVSKDRAGKQRVLEVREMKRPAPLPTEPAFHFSPAPTSSAVFTD